MKLIKLTLATVLLSASAFAAATPLFVGSWNLYSGPYYAAPELPQLYTGQQAAAALFGGTAGDYLISTAGSNVDDIDYQAWYDAYGFMPHILAQDAMNDHGLPGVYDAWYDVSAMVMDHYYTGSAPYPYVNYAFRVNAAADVPEPMSACLMGAGLLGMGLVRRRRMKRK